MQENKKTKGRVLDKVKRGVRLSPLLFSPLFHGSSSLHFALVCFVETFSTPDPLRKNGNMFGRWRGECWLWFANVDAYAGGVR